MKSLALALACAVALALVACDRRPAASVESALTPVGTRSAAAVHAEQRLKIYAPVRLTADLGGLAPTEREILRLLIDASRSMDRLFWLNAYGEPQQFLIALPDPALQRFARINYGPWDRLDGDRPFVPGVGSKPAGANFYPPDMSPEEFETADLPGKDSPYSVLRRDARGMLEVVPYHVIYREELDKAAQLLRQAAALAGESGLGRYLELRAQALVTDEFQASDIAWLDMKDNPIDVVIGPIERYEDQLYGYKTAYQAYVLLKDRDWSERLSRYAQFLPALQQGLPVAQQYKREMPGTDSDLNAYDVLYYAGYANAGSKTIAINLPNDEEVQLSKGTRRLQLKNAMRAKFDAILMPIADQLIATGQRANITFNAFFANVMFHEVAHGLGIKNTINGQGTVREALREHHSPLEEAKADVLGLYMVTRLFEQGELREGELLDHYVTFLAGFFRSVRFGAASAHGRANMLQFNFLEQQGAFTRADDTGRYRVDLPAMQAAIESLAGQILRLQGDGAYDAAGKWLDEQGVIGTTLRADLDRLTTADIPVDVVFEQGIDVLGLTATVGG